MFKVNLLPARFGDAIWIEYGDEHTPNRLLIDGGTAGTSNEIRTALQNLPTDQRCFELVVVSHIDRDHIEGILSLLNQTDPGFDICDIWFNGWLHLPGNAQDEYFGAVQAERLTERILNLHIPWNKAFNCEAIYVPEDGPLPQKTLVGGMKLTLLSPNMMGLASLKPKWEHEVRQANLDPGFGLDVNDDLQPDEEEESFGAEELPDIDTLVNSAFVEDTSEANGSSIALLAEYEGKRMLLAADAHPSTLLTALDQLSPGERISIDLFKISHHGSRGTTCKELIQKVDCPRYLFSTNGAQFEHPHKEAVARTIRFGGKGVELIFNYRSKFSGLWDDPTLISQNGYRVAYPECNEVGKLVTI